jgi:hypothetical protein
MAQDFSPITALVLIVVSYDRVIRPALVFPPSVSAFYDAYVGLNPMVSSFFIAVLTMSIVGPFVLVSSDPIGVSEKAFPLLLHLLAQLYVIHAPLSSDNATGGLPDKRLALMSFLVFFWAFSSMLSAVADGRFAATFEDRTVSVVRNRLGWLPLIVLSGSIACARSIIAFLLLSPLSFAWDVRGSEISSTDVVLGMVFVVCVVLKYIAGMHCRNFQTSNPDHRAPYSQVYGSMCSLRILAELSTWSCILGFAVHVSGKLVPWPAAGVVLHAIFMLLHHAVARNIDGYPYTSNSMRKSRSYLSRHIAPHVSEETTARLSNPETKKIN